NLILGPLVLLSYVFSASTWPGHTEALWGDIPERFRSVYVTNMFLAAFGYLTILYYVLRHTYEGATRFIGAFGLGYVNFATVLILIPSAIWMPLTSYALDQQLDLLIAIQVVLWLVAAGSLLLLMGLFTVTPDVPRKPLMVARAGAIFFCVQTVVLDAVVWPL